MFLISAADRVGLTDAWDAAIPWWIKVAMTTASLAILAASVADFVRKMAGAGHLLCIAAATVPSGCAGAAFDFRQGVVVVLSFWTVTGAAVFVLRPLLVASTLTAMREGDILRLSHCECTWVLLKPIGDGGGLLASLGYTRVRTLPERSLLRMNLPCTGVRVAGRLGIVELVELVLAVRLAEACQKDELLELALRLQRPVRVIQRAWRRARADPGYSACRTRLLREATEFDEDLRQHRDSNTAATL
jgi:hypothetical protein